MYPGGEFATIFARMGVRSLVNEVHVLQSEIAGHIMNMFVVYTKLHLLGLIAEEIVDTLEAVDVPNPSREAQVVAAMFQSNVMVLPAEEVAKVKKPVSLP